VRVYNIILTLTTTRTRNVPTLLAERGFATRPHDRAGLEPHTRALCRVYPIYYDIIITIIIIIIRVVSFFQFFVGDPQRSRL